MLGQQFRSLCNPTSRSWMPRLDWARLSCDDYQIWGGEWRIQYLSLQPLGFNPPTKFVRTGRTSSICTRTDDFTLVVVLYSKEETPRVFLLYVISIPLLTFWLLSFELPDFRVVSSKSKHNSFLRCVPSNDKNGKGSPEEYNGWLAESLRKWVRRLEGIILFLLPLCAYTIQ